MPLPEMTPEQRAAARAEGLRTRAARADVKRRLRAREVTLAELISGLPGDGIAGGMKVSALVSALPGVGKVRTAQVMERLGIHEKRRLRGLGPNQLAALQAEFTPAAA